MKKYFFFQICFLFLIGCKKGNFLDERPDKSVVIPTSLEDFQQILDNEIIMNGTINTTGIVPSLGELAADDYYIIDGGFSSTLFTVADKKLYLWNDEIGDNATDDWIIPYKSIFYANLAIDGCSKFPASELKDNIKGSALFYRAHLFYQLAQNFAIPYKFNSTDQPYGIPLRLSADVNEKVFRATVKNSYNKIVSDLMEAQELLPIEPKYKTRPSKLAVWGLLARLYLSIGDYENALIYAQKFLQVKNDLLDFNSATNLPVFQENPEVVFQCLLLRHILLSSSRNRVNQSLYSSYHHDDLRKSRFFRVATNPVGGRFRASYDGSSAVWAGIATDEILLIRAECLARSGNITSAMSELNRLLRNRWNNLAQFNELTAQSKEEAINLILVERRKELVFRGIRWSDLRRLNNEGRDIILERNLDGDKYILPPNSLHYTFLIPPSATMFNSDWQQNPR